MAATSSLSPKCGSSGPNNCEDGDKQDTTMRSSKFPTETRGWFLSKGAFTRNQKGRKVVKKKKERIRKVCRSNEHFNVWLNKSTVFSEQRRERGGPWRICLGLRMEVKLSSKTMGFCVLLCHLYLRTFLATSASSGPTYKVIHPPQKKKRKSALCLSVVVALKRIISSCW